MIRVIHPGVYSSVQDTGRAGFAKMGIPISGVMDSEASELANALLQNKKSDAVIEVTFGRAKFEFTSDTYISITGADFSAQLNDESIKLSKVYEVTAGSLLTFGKRNYGVRTYVAVQGGIQSEAVLGSRSFFKGITSEVHFKKGDELSILPKKSLTYQNIHKNEDTFNSNTLTCFPGPEFEQLTEEQKQRLFQPFTISADNNRVGYRLNELIENNLDAILTSSVLPGTVQLTPSGKLIVLMRDCQVTGGYPRVLQLSEKSICRLSQTFTGDQIQFSL
jgi:biotin-dependent carboxylase-like uncharacterized protein